MASDLKYPVQPFVFEFAKEASKSLNFKDIYLKPSPTIDLSPVDHYLQNNGAFLDDFGVNSDGRNSSQPSQASIANCRVKPIFFRKDFDLRRKDVFQEVFTNDCLKKRLFHEGLLLQLDSVQSLLFHSSDKQALEFFRSFSTIHDMNHDLSILLPQVKNMRHDLSDLDTMSKSSENIDQLRVQKERLNSLSVIINQIQKVTNASVEIIALSDRQEFDAAFELTEELMNGQLPSMLGIKALRPQIQKFKNIKEIISKKAIAAFHNLFTITVSEALTNSYGSNSAFSIIDTLQKRNLIETAVSEAKTFISEYAVDSVNRILSDASDQKGFKGSNLSSLSVQVFTEVLSAASPNIRSRILAKSTDSITRIIKEFEDRGIPHNFSDGLIEVSQILVDRVFREVTTVVSSHPLKNASLNDFSALMEAMISISRSFDKFDIDTTLISASIITLGRSFVESFHCEQMKRLTQALAQEKFVRKNPEKVHIDILGKLTSNEGVNGFMIKNEHYGSTASLLVLLEVTWSYWQAARRLPKTQDDITCKMCETIKLFNSQCRDLVLLGGTSHTVNMRTISTKHLALSAAGLYFFINLIPFIKPRISAVGATSDVVNLQFDDVTKCLEIHINQVVDKIIEIMTSLISKKCAKSNFPASNLASNLASTLSSNINSNNSDQQQNNVNSQYVVDIVNEVATLNKVITDCLPSDIATKIFRKIAEKISVEMTKLAPKGNNANREVFKRDLDFLNEKLKVCRCSVYVQGYTASNEF